MVSRFLKKMRKFRVLSVLAATFVLLVSFQNCAPAPQTEEKTSSSGSTNQSSTGTSNTNRNVYAGNNSGSGGLAVGGAGYGGGSSNGTSGGGVAGSGGGISTGGGSGSGSSSSGGGAVGGSGSSENGTLRVTSHPNDVSVYENNNFDLKVEIAGGKGPFKFQWYRNGQKITEGLGAYSYFSDSANSYYKEGTYYVEVTDSTNYTIRSSNARVVIVEPAVGCAAGSYFTYTVQSYDLSFNYFTEYFDGPRGKFILARSFDIYNFFYQAGRYAGLATYSIGADLPYKGTMWMNCRTSVPRIHSPQANPSTGEMSDSNYYRYEGAINFECHNKKLKFVSNTCKWNYYPPPQSYGSNK